MYSPSRKFGTAFQNESSAKSFLADYTLSYGISKGIHCNNIDMAHTSHRAKHDINVKHI